MALSLASGGTGHHLRPLGQSIHGVVADLSGAQHVPTLDNIQQYTAEPSTATPGQEIRVTIPVQEQPGRHVQVADIVLEFQLAYAGDARDIIVRNAGDLIREIRLWCENGQELLRINDQFEAGFLLRQHLMDDWYDPRYHACGWIPPCASTETNSVVAAGAEVLPVAGQASYAFIRQSDPEVVSSPYRHRFQIPLSLLFGKLFDRLDARRFRTFNLSVQFLPDAGLGVTGNAICFDTNTGSYSNVTFTNIGCRVYRSVYVSRPGSLFLPTTAPLKHVLYRYDWATLPISLGTAGQYSVVVNLNQLFPPRRNVTRLYWAFAPVAATDTASIVFPFEHPGTLRKHLPWMVQVDYQGQTQQRIETAWEMEQHRRNSKLKRGKNSSETRQHWLDPTSVTEILFYDFDCAHRPADGDQGVEHITGIDTSSNGANQEYVLTLRSSAYRPAVVGGPTALWLIMESQLCLQIQPGTNLSGPGAQVKVY